MHFCEDACSTNPQWTRLLKCVPCIDHCCSLPKHFFSLFDTPQFAVIRRACACSSYHTVTLIYLLHATRVPRPIQSLPFSYHLDICWSYVQDANHPHVRCNCLNKTNTAFSYSVRSFNNTAFVRRFILPSLCAGFASTSGCFDCRFLIFSFVSFSSRPGTELGPVGLVY